MYKLYALLAIIVFAIINSCSTNAIKKTLLNTDQLKSDTLRIDITRDTQLVTSKGAFIIIPKGSLSTTKGSIAELEIKEAYSIQDMLIAGLSTTSNGQLLSSGGMFYINSIGENKASIVKPLSVSIPTPFINTDMSQFKGVEKEDGTIDWTDPKPLAANPQQLQIDTGKRLFQINCAPCHAIGKSGTGPDLGHIVKRSPGWQNIWGEEGTDTLHTNRVNMLYEWTLNWNRAVSQNPYYNCMKDWSPTAQTVFENLNYHDLDMLYAYIENESYLKNLPLGDTTLPSCYDSCLLYKELKDIIVENRFELTEESINKIKRVILTANKDSIYTSNAANYIRIPSISLVEPTKNSNLYYKISIEKYGWSNIDALLKDLDNVQNSKLAVIVNDFEPKYVTIYLAVPSHKALIVGGVMDYTKRLFGFYEKNGSILLPQKTNASVIAIAEKDGKLYLGIKKFTTSLNMNISLPLQEVSKDSFYKKVGELSREDFSFNIIDSKNEDSSQPSNLQLQEIKKFKPTRCNCDCLITPKQIEF